MDYDRAWVKDLDDRARQFADLQTDAAITAALDRETSRAAQIKRLSFRKIIGPVTFCIAAAGAQGVGYYAMLSTMAPQKPEVMIAPRPSADNRPPSRIHDLVPVDVQKRPPSLSEKLFLSLKHYQQRKIRDMFSAGQALSQPLGEATPAGRGRNR
jgi:hypothetical protein